MKIAKISVTLVAFSFFMLIGCEKPDIYTEENCTEVFIPCVNAYTKKDGVKVENGTYSLKIGGQHVESDADYEYIIDHAERLQAKREETVTLEYINKTPLHLEAKLLGEYQKREKVEIKDNSFVTPKESGTYTYEIAADYSNGGVFHILVVEVK